MAGMRSLGDILDVIIEPRYDTVTILAAGALNLTYFALPIGQGATNFGAATVTKSLADTNMDLAGQLPAGYNFFITGFRVQPAFTMTNIDATTWSAGGVFTFTIGSKPFLRVPIDTIPAGVGPFGTFGTAGLAAAGGMTSHGWPALSNGYVIARKPLELAQTQNFQVVLSWVTVKPVTSVVVGQAAAGLPVRVYMDGWLKRIVQ
jgi:hypothetical protein